MKVTSAAGKLQSHKNYNPIMQRCGKIFFVDVGREGFGRKQMFTGLLWDITDRRDMSGGFSR